MVELCPKKMEKCSRKSSKRCKLIQIQCSSPTYIEKAKIGCGSTEMDAAGLACHPSEQAICTKSHLKML